MTAADPPGTRSAEDLNRAAVAALSSRDLADALRLFQTVIDGDANAQTRGEAFLGRAVTRLLGGESTAAAADVTSALDAWRSVDRMWLAAAMQQIGSALVDCGAIAAAARFLDTASALRPPESMAAAIEGEKGRVRALRGDHAGAQAQWHKAAAIAGRAGAAHVGAAAKLNVAVGNAQDDGELLEAVRDIGGNSGATAHSSVLAGVLADVAGRRAGAGDPVGAGEIFREALALPLLDGQVRRRLLLGVAGAAHQRGDLASAALALHQAVETHRGRDSALRAAMLHDAGVLACEDGRLDEARGLFEESAASAQRVGAADIAEKLGALLEELTPG